MVAQIVTFICYDFYSMQQNNDWINKSWNYVFSFWSILFIKVSITLDNCKVSWPTWTYALSWKDQHPEPNITRALKIYIWMELWLNLDAIGFTVYSEFSTLDFLCSYFLCSYFLCSDFVVDLLGTKLTRPTSLTDLI